MTSLGSVVCSLLISSSKYGLVVTVVDTNYMQLSNASRSSSDHETTPLARDRVESWSGAPWACLEKAGNWARVDDFHDAKPGSLWLKL